MIEQFNAKLLGHLLSCAVDPERLERSQPQPGNGNQGQTGCQEGQQSPALPGNRLVDNAAHQQWLDRPQQTGDDCRRQTGGDPQPVRSQIA